MDRASTWNERAWFFTNVGLTWATGDVKGGFAMQCDKNDYRAVLTGLEGVTGKKAVDSEAMNVKN